MRLTRCHVGAPLTVGDTVDLPAQVAAHLIRVLRLKEGTAVVLFNGDGHDYHAELVQVRKFDACARILARHVIANESPGRLVLVQALLRGEKMDYVLQKATELGVSAIIPVMTEYGEIRLDDERGNKRQLRWQGIIASACEQSGRARLPQLAPVLPLASWLQQAPQHGLDAHPDDSRLRLPVCYLDPTARHTLHDAPISAKAGACFVIGPEGGLGPRDLACLADAGAVGLRLGPRILRTETAGLAVLAAAQTLWGDY